MSDIVERLRLRASGGPAQGQLDDEAADEIERLHTEFKRFMDICGEGSAKGRAMDLIDKRDWERARAALEGE